MSLPDESSSFDPNRRYVRIVEERSDGLVEFEFAVGEPGLFVEMLMPREAFETFCRDQGAQRLDDRPAEGVAGVDGLGWSLHDARNQRFDRLSSSTADDVDP